MQEIGALARLQLEAFINGIREDGDRCDVIANTKGRGLVESGDAITIPDRSDLLRLGAVLGQAELTELAYDAIVDDYGLNVIVYFPGWSLGIAGEDEEDDEEDED
jgi:hypothetical protein